MDIPKKETIEVEGNSPEDRAINLLNGIADRSMNPLTSLVNSERAGRNLREFIDDIDQGRVGRILSIRDLISSREKDFAVVVGASPFLENHAEWLIECREAADVFCSPTALPAFVRMTQSWPDYVVVADDHPVLVDDVNDLPGVEDANFPVIVPTTTCARWRTSSVRKRLFYYQPVEQNLDGGGVHNSRYNQLLKNLIPEVEPFIMQSGNVTNVSLLASVFLGYRAAVLAGCDNAFRPTGADDDSFWTRCWHPKRPQVERPSNILYVNGRATDIKNAMYVWNLIALYHYQDNLRVAILGKDHLLTGKLPSALDTSFLDFEFAARASKTPEIVASIATAFAQEVEASIRLFAATHPDGEEI